MESGIRRHTTHSIENTGIFFLHMMEDLQEKKILSQAEVSNELAMSQSKSYRDTQFENDVPSEKIKTDNTGDTEKFSWSKFKKCS